MGVSVAATHRTAHKPLAPFQVDHFARYARLLVLDNGEQWEPEGFQLEVAEDLFGGTPEVWMVVPEGNGKTTFMGGIALYFADYTPSANVLLAASSRDQCGILLGQASGFVYRTPALAQRFRVFEGYRRIQALRSGGRIQVFSADDRTGDGVIPGGIVLFDELHRNRDLRLYRTWRGKLAKRDAVLAAISTAGEPGTEFEEVRERALRESPDLRRVGSHTRAASDEMILHDWAVPAGADVEDMDAVKAANPFSGVTVEMLETKRASHTMTLAHWRRFVCNQATRSTSSAIAPEEWAARRTDDRIPEGEPVWVGADFGWKWDTTAIVPLWMPELDRRVFDRVEIITPPRDGFSTPPEDVQAAFLRIHERNPIHTVVMDENAGGAQMAGWIETVLGAEVVAYSQSHAPMALAYDRWMEAMREGWMWHTGDQEFTRHVLNAVAKLLPGGQTRFDRPAKSRAGSQQDRRVWDALTAACIVHSVAVDEHGSTSVYEERGVMVLDLS
jgi:phage terminase large subunit-like protein